MKYLRRDVLCILNNIFSCNIVREHYSKNLICHAFLEILNISIWRGQEACLYQGVVSLFQIHCDSGSFIVGFRLPEFVHERLERCQIILISESGPLKSSTVYSKQKCETFQWFQQSG